jgi:superfamily II DNA or RNA helicase
LLKYPMSDAANGNLLELLKEYAPGQVYGCAPRSYVLRGVDYYRSGRFRGFEWSADGTILASVKGTKAYTVEIFYRDDRISHVCDCPAWTPSSNCKHVVCALLALIDIAGREGLSAAMETGDDTGHSRHAQPHKTASMDESEGRFSIAVVVRDDFFDIKVCRNGADVSWNDHRKVPPDLRWLAGGYSDPASKLKTLLFRVETLGRKYPVVLRTAEGETRLRYRKSDKYTARTGLDACGAEIKVEKLFLKNGLERNDLLSAGPFVLDPSEQTFSEMGDTSGWDLWKDFFFSLKGEYATLQNRDTQFAIPADPEGTTVLYFSPEEAETPRHLTLKVDGTGVSHESRPPSHRITISRNGTEAFFELRASGEVAGAITPTFEPLFSFFSRLGNGLPQPLKAKKRKEVLVRAFFEMLSASSTQIDKVLRRTVSDLELRDYSAKRRAKRMLNEHLFYLAPDHRLLLFHEGKWISVAVDKKAEAQLYRIPYEVFGWEIFSNSPRHDVVRVDTQNLIENLPLLYRRCRDAGVALYFEGKLVMETRYDFSFDVSRPGGIDWFEIRPEIRCDGDIIGEEVFQKMVEKGGAIEESGCVRVMDSNSQKVFSILSSIYQAAGASQPGRKEIVTIPRLRILDWIMLRKSGVSVRLPAGEEEIIERLTLFEKIGPRELPQGVKARLRRYQKEGYAWLSFLYEHGFGACLADDMGLGKTLQAISLLAGIKEGKVVTPGGQSDVPHLIVVPPSLLFNWENEIRKFAPRLRIVFYTGKERAVSFDDCDAVITTYGLVRRDSEKLGETAFDVIIFDEAHAVKNIRAATTGAVRQLKARFKLAMTGTPLENHVGEYYSLIDLVVPGLLGDYDDFRPMINSGASPVLDIIIRRTKPFVLRRTKEMILKELPPKVETDIYLDLTEKQKSLYTRTAAEIRDRIDVAYRTKTKAQAGIIALTAILKLRQICVAPGLVSPASSGPSPKIEFLIGRLRELLDEGHSALVFSQFTSFLDILEKHLAENGILFQRLDGSTNVRKRKEIVEGFQSGNGASVFLLSLKAGGQGLNLTRASYVFHLDPWWNPAVENQASDRAHRIGQKRKVTVTRVLMRHTIEEKMMTLKARKMELYKAVIEGAESGGKGLSIRKEDFEFLLK